MLNRMKSLVQDEEGATMVEYALMVALIAVVAIASVQLLGGKVNTTFNSTQAVMP
ncbi:MAG: Flp family type IVb pilin [Armatimonadota bacterium]